MQNLSAAWDHARAELPDVKVSRDEFEAYLTRKGVPLPMGDGRARPEVVVADLYLACACSRGDTAGIATFERRYASVIDGVRSRFGRRAPSRPELWSELCHRLFTPRGDKPGKIEEYSGKSELSAWLRVVTLRVLLNWLDAQKPEQSFEERILAGMLVTEASPESAFGRAEHQAALRRAFALAIGELSARERRLLRLSFAEGFTIDELGSLYDVHRATAARWVKDDVDKLGTSIRHVLRAELGLSPSAYESWARELTSSMGVSLHRFLATESGG